MPFIKHNNITFTGNISANNIIANTLNSVNASSVGGLTWQAAQTSNFTAASGNAYPVNTTSGPITVTLPASPNVKDQIIIVDYAGTAATNNIFIYGNGNKIEGAIYNVNITMARQAYSLIYIDSTQGWIPYSQEYTPLLSNYTISYLLVAGGGSGGGAGYAQSRGGGGGAGGLITGNVTAVHGAVYCIVVGGGATAGSPGLAGNGLAGSNSFITSSGTATTANAIGGGGGQSYQGSGSNGGSGGGGATGLTPSYSTYKCGTTGQGNRGGYGNCYVNNSCTGGGGGGGATAVGANALSPNPTGAGGAGGAGYLFPATGLYYAGGGGGGGGKIQGNGGVGGGANGAFGCASGNNATQYTGGGGGGGGVTGGPGAATHGGSGGSGVVILTYSSPVQIGTGGTVTSNTSAPYAPVTLWIHTFTSSGTYTA